MRRRMVGESKIRGIFWVSSTSLTVINSCGLIDLPFKGQILTWFSIKDGIVIRERLDIALVNVEWEEKYPGTQLFNLPAVGSDHSPIFLDSDFKEMKTPRKFRFELVWTELQECEQLIRNSWDIQIQGSNAFKLVKKLRNCREELRLWSKKTIPNNRTEIEDLMRKIGVIQKEANM